MERSLLQKQGRNAEVDFLRLVMSLTIMMYHSNGFKSEGITKYPFVGGYLAVEFFFMVSGYLAVCKVVNNPTASYKSALFWVGRKFRPIFTYVIPIGIVDVILYSVFRKEAFLKAIKRLIYTFYEMFLLRAAGFGESDYYLQGHLWYLSALMVMLPLFFAVLIKGREFFLYVGAPLSISFIYGYFSTNVQYQKQHVWLGLFKQALPRAWAGLCLGGVIYLLVKWIDNWPPLSKKGAHMLSVIEYACFGIALLYMYTTGRKQLDYFCIALLLISATIAFSQKASVHKVFSPFFCRLSEFTLVFYISHWTISYRVLGVALKDMTWERRLALYAPMSVLYALLWMAIVHIVRRFDLPARWKKVFFEV